MTNNDKKAKINDCQFMLIVKLPSGDVHPVNIKNRDLKEFLAHNSHLGFGVFSDKILNLTFEPVL